MSEKKICQLSCAPMRREPSDKSEMVNQIIYGETAEVMDENEKWLMIRLDHDGYEGWIDKKQVQPYTERIETRLVNDLFESIEGRIIPCGGSTPGKPSVRKKESEWLKSLINQFLGSPYLWGGRTFMGIDCSGFVQVVYRTLGKTLPRDAYQQAELGETISFIEECAMGDLAFFDNPEGRIIHVGVIMGKDADDKLRIAHASGEVRLDFLDHQGIFHAQKGIYSHNLRLLKRL